MARTIALLLAAAVSAGAQLAPSFPHTNKNGRATVVYQHEGQTFVANYDYSQRNHDAPWLLIDVALGSSTRFVLHRNDFRLVTPAGQAIRLASQQAGESDPNGINKLLQNARIHRRELDGYFPQRNTQETIHFVSLPFARSISDEAVVDNDRVTSGPLLFRSLDGGWPEGTYSLTLDNPRMKAALPIALQ